MEIKFPEFNELGSNRLHSTEAHCLFEALELGLKHMRVLKTKETDAEKIKAMEADATKIVYALSFLHRNWLAEHLT